MNIDKHCILYTWAFQSSDPKRALQQPEKTSADYGGLFQRNKMNKGELSLIDIGKISLDLTLNTKPKCVKGFAAGKIARVKEMTDESSYTKTS